MKGSALVAVAVMAMLGAACSSEREKAEDFGTMREKITGTETLAFELPLGTEIADVAVSATNLIYVGDRAKVQPTTASGPATLTSTGSGETTIGVKAQTRNIVSEGTIALRNDATVTGNAVTHKKVTKQTGAKVTGTTTEDAILTPKRRVTRDYAFPGGTTYTRGPDAATLPLSPGGFGHLTINARSTVVLNAAAGAPFYFESITVEPTATLEVRTSGGFTPIFVRGALNFKGTFKLVGDPGDVFIGVFGTGTTSLETVVSGTIMAPNGTLRFAPAFKEFRGSFFGKSIQIEPDLTLSYVPFKHWGSIFPPVPFVSCVSQVAPGQYAALFGYENPLNRVENVPLGSQNSLTPAATAASSQPLSVFQPGRVERGFWSLMTSPTLTWNVRSFSATASPSSPGCDRNAYPTASGRPAPGERPSPPVARDGKLIPYFVDPSHDATMPAALQQTTASSSSASQLGVQQQALASGFKPKFQVRLTNLTTGQDGCFASRTVDAEVLVDGASLGRRRVYDDGCVFCWSACSYGEPVTLNELFEVEIPEDRPSVTVRIKLHEIDNIDDDVVRDVSFTVDNLTGLADRATKCEGGEWGVCWDFKATGLPAAVPATKICPKWNTDYVDESWGEDILGARASNTEAARYPASFAGYSLEVTSPVGTISQSGFLDAAGCVALDGATAKSLVFRTEGGADTNNGGLGLTLLLNTDLARPDGVSYELRSFRGSPAADTTTPDVFRFSSQNPGDVPLSSWTPNNIWSVAPAEIELRLAPVGGRQVLSPMMNVGAVLSRVLAAPDTGITPGKYPVVQGRGCVYNGQVNSCVSNGTLLVGGPNFPPTPPACTADSQCASVQQCLETNFAPCPAGSTTCKCSWPDQARWKFVSAHEAGHQIQDPAMGGFNTTDYTFDCPPNTTCTGVKSGSTDFADEYVDPPFVDQAGFCGCQHVGAANAEHCLQSVERSGAAQGEGFAQFFASKVFNNQSDADCTFVYYKEFFDTTCHANDPADCAPITAGMATGINTLPPFGISCRSKIKWRNGHCPVGAAAEMGTELDWMVFLWNLNTVGPTPSPMTDVWKIYRHACNPPAAGQPPSNSPAACSGNEELSWSARPVLELTPARTCRWDKAQEDCQRGERCLNATVGSGATCTSASPSCVCKLPAVGGILDGAQRAYANDADRRENVADVGDSSGVSRDLSP